MEHITGNMLHGSPYLEITEQPKQRGMRFRYECEGRSAGSIPGKKMTQERKSWPGVRIHNYVGDATVRVSLVSKDDPPRPHPHSLVGKDCDNGICVVRINQETQMTAVFSNLGIQCVKRREVIDSLRERRNLGVDPYNTYQNPDDHPSADIDLNIVRLCFEAFIVNRTHQVALPPVLSEPIYDKKATSSALLRICRVDKSFGSCKGGDEVYLLCDKVQKDDISVCFFCNTSKWESYGEFSPTDVHRQVAIVFRTPPYHDQNISSPKKVLFQLKRTSDGETSDTKEFMYLPVHHDQPHIRQPTKRPHPGNPAVREAIIKRCYATPESQAHKLVKPETYVPGPTQPMTSPMSPMPFPDISSFEREPQSRQPSVHAMNQYLQTNYQQMNFAPSGQLQSYSVDASKFPQPQWRPTTRPSDPPAPMSNKYPMTYMTELTTPLPSSASSFQQQHTHLVTTSSIQLAPNNQLTQSSVYDETAVSFEGVNIGSMNNISFSDIDPNNLGSEFKNLSIDESLVRELVKQEPQENSLFQGGQAANQTPFSQQTSGMSGNIQFPMSPNMDHGPNLTFHIQPATPGSALPYDAQAPTNFQNTQGLRPQIDDTLEHIPSFELDDQQGLPLHSFDLEDQFSMPTRTNLDPNNQ